MQPLRHFVSFIYSRAQPGCRHNSLSSQFVALVTVSAFRRNCSSRPAWVIPPFPSTPTAVWEDGSQIRAPYVGWGGVGREHIFSERFLELASNLALENLPKSGIAVSIGKAAVLQFPKEVHFNTNENWGLYPGWNKMLGSDFLCVAVTRSRPLTCSSTIAFESDF